MNRNNNFKNPIISIVVPIYNVEKYINKCINSILNQTFYEFELILVDDGSKDQSGKICDEYLIKDNRVKVIQKKNGGLSSARNTGLNIAVGEYVIFIDSDDFINKNMIEILYKSIIKNSSDIVICRYNEVLEDKVKDYIDQEIVCISHINEKNFTNIEALNELYEINAGVFTVAWNKLYRKKLFDDLRYTENRIHEDEYIIHELLYRSNKITYIPIELYNYVKRRNSIMSTEFSFRNFDAIYAFVERMKFFKDKNLKSLKYKAEYNYITKYFKYYYTIKNNKDEMKKVFNANLYELLKNPLFNLKEKILWIIFYIRPKYHKKIYEKY